MPDDPAQTIRQPLRLAMVTNRPLISSACENLAQAQGIQFSTVEFNRDPVSQIQIRQPSCVLVDVAAAPPAAVEICRTLRDDMPSLPLVLLITSMSSVPTAQFGAILACQPAGLLGPSATPEEIIRAGRLVVDGHSVFHLDPSSSASALLEGWWRAASRALSTDFSSEEEELLRMIAEGLSDGEIARKLYASQPTVRRRIMALRLKTTTDNRAELAAWAGAHGYYEPRRPMEPLIG